MLSELETIDRVQRVCLRAFPWLDVDALQFLAVTYLEHRAKGAPPTPAVVSTCFDLRRYLQRRASPVGTRRARSVALTEAVVPVEPSPLGRLEALDIWAALPEDLWPVARLWMAGYDDSECAERLGVVRETVVRWRARARRHLAAAAGLP